MIGSLRGTVVERRMAGETAVELVVDVGGVGYRVLVAPRLASVLTGSAPEVSLSVHTHVREGAITLYGFAEPAERRAFELLIGAHGVGPALALAIVSVHDPGRLVEIVTRGDADALTLVPGVGRKTAARLLVELKSRFDLLDGATPAGLGSGLGGGEAGDDGGTGLSSAAEVSDALGQLGYAPDEIRSALRTLPATGSVEELLRSALRELAPRR